MNLSKCNHASLGHVAGPRRPAAAAIGYNVHAKGSTVAAQSSARVLPARSTLVGARQALAQAKSPVHTSVDLTEDEQTEVRFWQGQVKAVLGSFSALPIERLHNIIKFTSTSPKLNKSVSELDLYCTWMLDEGELVRDNRGWLALPDGIPRPSVAKAPATDGHSAGNGNGSPTPLLRTGSPVPVAARVPTPRPSVAAYPPHLRELAPFHYQILGLMGNFRSMPLTRLHTVLALTIISPKFDKTEAQLEQFVAWLVEDGQLACDAQTGWYSYCEPKSPPTVPAPPRPTVTVTTPAPLRAAALTVAPARAAPAPAHSPEPAPAAAVVRTPEPSPEPQQATEEQVPEWMPTDARARLPSPVAKRGPDSAPPAKAVQPEQYGQLATLVTALALSGAVALGIVGTYAAVTKSNITPNVGYQYKPVAARAVSTAVPSAAKDATEDTNELRA